MYKLPKSIKLIGSNPEKSKSLEPVRHISLPIPESVVSIFTNGKEYLPKVDTQQAKTVLKDIHKAILKEFTDEEITAIESSKFEGMFISDKLAIKLTNIVIHVTYERRGETHIKFSRI